MIEKERPKPHQASGLERTQDIDAFRPRSEEDFSALGLAYRAAPLADAFKGRLPSKAELQNITEELGVELATFVFLKTVQLAQGHGEFERRLRGIDPSELRPQPAIRNSVEILLVASNFSLSGRKWGEQAEVWRKWARDLGFQTEVIETSSRLSVAENARLMSEHLRAHPHPCRILVTYGQGTSEFRYLLERRSANFSARELALATQNGNESSEINGAIGRAMKEFAGLRAWVSVCGSYFGASANRHINSSHRRRLSHQFQLWRNARSVKTLSETSPEFLIWKGVPAVLKDVLMTSIVGCPLRAQLPFDLRETYDQIAKTSPNDGVVSFSEASAPGGFILPVAGMSHRAEDQKLKPVLSRTLILLSQSILSQKTDQDLSLE